MRDGIDHRAFSAEIKTLAPQARRTRMRALGEWMRAASRTVGGWIYLGLVFTGCGVAVALSAFVLHPYHRALVPLGVSLLGVGTALNLWSNRRARQWRRAHPFHEWSAGK